MSSVLIRCICFDKSQTIYFYGLFQANKSLKFNFQLIYLNIFSINSYILRSAVYLHVFIILKIAFYCYYLIDIFYSEHKCELMVLFQTICVGSYTFDIAVYTVTQYLTELTTQHFCINIFPLFAVSYLLTHRNILNLMVYKFERMPCKIIYKIKIRKLITQVNT